MVRDLGVWLDSELLLQHLIGQLVSVCFYHLRCLRQIRRPVLALIISSLDYCNGVFAGLPQDFSATRYHSLVVERASLPDELEITAETSDGVIMGLQHKRYPVHGVQFHPESIASEHGHQLLSNFLDLARVPA